MFPGSCTTLEHDADSLTTNVTTGAIVLHIQLCSAKKNYISSDFV
jgi:hypothetical protein